VSTADTLRAPKRYCSKVHTRTCTADYTVATSAVILHSKPLQCQLSHCEGYPGDNNRVSPLEISRSFSKAMKLALSFQSTNQENGILRALLSVLRRSGAYHPVAKCGSLFLLFVNTRISPI